MAKAKLVALTGAGISAESGLRTFRDSNGLWEGYDVEDVATPRAWERDRELVLRFYNERRQNVLDAEPNAAHQALAYLQDYYDVQIVTQNIDDLHERAGSKKVLHLHGEIFRMRSEKQPHDDRHAEEIRDDIAFGQKAADGGQYRPHIVWFEEQVPAIPEATRLMEGADVFVLVGTSLVVYPAAGLMDFLRPGCPKYVIDRSIPPVSQYRNIIPIEQPATEGVASLIGQLGLPPMP